MAYVRDDGVAVMKVDDTTVLREGEHRKSVRIHTKKQYNGGLFLFDLIKMPMGCSFWPAGSLTNVRPSQNLSLISALAWTSASNWPGGGEIDIVEGVHNQTSNQSTLHTNPGCKLDTTNFNPDPSIHVSGNTFVGKVLSDNCDANLNFNAGCGIKDEDERSYGFGLATVGGGVCATLWDDNGIKICRHTLVLATPSFTYRHTPSRVLPSHRGSGRRQIGSTRPFILASPEKLLVRLNLSY